MVKEQNQTEEVNGKSEKGAEENVSVLTLSLHPGGFIIVGLPVCIPRCL